MGTVGRLGMVRAVRGEQSQGQKTPHLERIYRFGQTQSSLSASQSASGVFPVFICYSIRFQTSLEYSPLPDPTFLSIVHIWFEGGQASRRPLTTQRHPLPH